MEILYISECVGISHTLLAKSLAGIIGYVATFSQTTNAIIRTPPNTMVVTTCADFQGLDVRFPGRRRIVLIVTSPLQSRQKQSNPADRQHCPNKVDANKNVTLCESK